MAPEKVVTTILNRYKIRMEGEPTVTRADKDRYRIKGVRVRVERLQHERAQQALKDDLPTSSTRTSTSPSSGRRAVPSSSRRRHAIAERTEVLGAGGATDHRDREGALRAEPKRAGREVMLFRLGENIAHVYARARPDEVTGQSHRDRRPISAVR